MSRSLSHYTNITVHSHIVERILSTIILLLFLANGNIVEQDHPITTTFTCFSSSTSFGGCARWSKLPRGTFVEPPRCEGTSDELPRSVAWVYILGRYLGASLFWPSDVLGLVEQYDKAHPMAKKGYRGTNGSSSCRGIAN